MKDWTGNSRTVVAQLGSSRHTETEREVDDFYATDPHSVEIFLEALKRDNLELQKNIWECACGQGHLSKVLKKHEYNVWSTDLVNRGYGEGNLDFLKYNRDWDGDIVTNPPYKYAKEFVEKALDICKDGSHVVMYLKIQFLEGQSRKDLFRYFPPKYVYVNSSRQACYINGDMSNKIYSATCFCWFIWEKGFTGEPVIRWID